MLITEQPCGDCGQPSVDGRVWHIAGCSRSIFWVALHHVQPRRRPRREPRPA